MKQKIFLAYLRLIGGLLAIYLLGTYADKLFAFFENSSDPALIIDFFIIACIFVLSFIVFYISSGTSLPPFVVAIFFGITAHPFLSPLASRHEGLEIIVSFGATLILFGGGLETPFQNFRKLFWKITSLSFLGLLLTAFLFSYILIWLGKIIGIDSPVAVAIVLGAVLASTDPAAIIPVLKDLKFHKRSTKDIIISESAMTDVTGTLLTVVFLSLLVAGVHFVSVGDGYTLLWSKITGAILLKQLFFGLLFGVLGYAALEVLTHFKTRHDAEYEVDAAFFFFVPIFIASLAFAFGGSGYLAAFIAGLFFSLTERLHETEHFFNHTVDGFLKPTIFLLLGALVEPSNLITYAPIGILSAGVFMFIIRPIAVFLTLGPFSFFGKEKLNIRELLFISFVRETGAIPAVLLVTVVSLGFASMEALVPIGMWVILSTLIVQPPLTPLVAKWLGVATPITSEDFYVNGSKDSFVVLASRGHSFLKRIGRAVEWADAHNIHRLILLHCPEDAYSKAFEEEIGALFVNEMESLNAKRREQAKKIVQYKYLPRKGFLEKNIEIISRQNNVTAIFVGKRMLDYRLEQVKKLSAALVFLE